MSDKITQEGSNAMNVEDVRRVKRALDAMGYDEAAQHVYGMDYPEWKKRHASKASEEQMSKFNASKPIWATHDKQILAKRAEMPDQPKPSTVNSSSANSTLTPAQAPSNLLSNVCCQPMEENPNLSVKETPQQPVPEPGRKSRTRQLPPYQGPDLPADLTSFSLGILTVSDRASSGQYETGDLSGPAVETAVGEVLKNSNNARVTLTFCEKAIVPDEVDAIASKLKDWCKGDKKMDLILTTGGTGFSPRDVTPEATQLVVDQPCPGLVAFCTMECAKLQPLASLSRGAAGVCGSTLIANLPGNPKGVKEIIPILLPLALHALADLSAA
jgi:molybdopterin adenylyltransferase